MRGTGAWRRVLSAIAPTLAAVTSPLGSTAWADDKPGGLLGPDAEAKFSRAIPDPVFKGSLADASREADAKNRLLLVFVYNDREPDVVDRMWRSPTVAAWVLWHAVLWVTPVSRAPAEFRTEISGVDRHATTLIFCGRTHEGTWIHEDVNQLAESVRRVTNPADVVKKIRIVAVNPMAVLFTAQLTLETISLRNAAWGMRHERVNSAPDPPPRGDDFATRSDGLAAPYAGPPLELRPPGAAAAEAVPGAVAPGAPPPAKPGSGVRAALAALDEARELVAKGDLWGATGRYTWLWERGLRNDPALAPLQLTVLAQEIQQVCRQRGESRERFQAIRDAMTPRLLWFDPPELDEWLTLNAVTDDDDLTGEHYARFLLDEHEASLMPVAERAGLASMAARADFAPRDTRASLTAMLTKLQRSTGRAERPRPTTIPPEDWEPFVAIHRRVVLSEAVGLHARALRGGHVDVAAAAGAIARAQGGPLGAYSAALAALWVHAAEADHERWINEAAETGADVTAARDRLGVATERRP